VDEPEQGLHGSGGVGRQRTVDDQPVGDLDQFGEERTGLRGVGGPPEEIGQIRHQQRRGDGGKLPLVLGADVDGHALEDDGRAATRGVLLQQIDLDIHTGRRAVPKRRVGDEHRRPRRVDIRERGDRLPRPRGVGSGARGRDQVQRSRTRHDDGPGGIGDLAIRGHAHGVSRLAVAPPEGI
jgi:hypothetical protein